MRDWVGWGIGVGLGNIGGGLSCVGDMRWVAKITLTGFLITMYSYRAKANVFSMFSRYTQHEKYVYKNHCQTIPYT